MCVCVCVRVCLCSLRTRQPEVRYRTFELKAAKSGQTGSEWLSHGRERETARKRERERNVQWIVIHLVGSCDVNSTDRATLHTLLPINLLKWISNATLGACSDLKLLSQTHTETKHTIFISSLGLRGKRVWEAVEMSRISMEVTAKTGIWYLPHPYTNARPLGLCCTLWR